MKSKEMDKKFQEGLELWNEGKSQEGAEIWMDLAEHGHLVSISELFYIFLDQNEFEAAKSYIECAKDQNDPTILYLKARLIEELDGIDAAAESFKVAADAGHSGSLSLVFDWAIQNRNIADAEYYLKQLQGHEEKLSKMKEPVTLDDLEQKLNSMRSKSEYEDADTHLEKLSEIYPVYFALASGNWMRSRSEMNERYEDKEVWENFLEVNGLTSEEFDRYEQWWIYQGAVVVASLREKFIDSIFKAAPPKTYKKLEHFLTKQANWDDFIRELSECTPSDGEASGDRPSYFCEYSIENGLCDTIWDSDTKFDQKLITELVETWFKNSYEESRSILLSAYDEIKKIL
jgi:tetratricopeptide (TPR) repeat protein